MIRKSITLLVVLFSIFTVSAQEKKYKVHTVAFYNVENLFDTTDDTKINDEEWLPSGGQNWTPEKYQKKLQNLIIYAIYQW